MILWSLSLSLKYLFHHQIYLSVSSKFLLFSLYILKLTTIFSFDTYSVQSIPTFRQQIISFGTGFLLSVLKLSRSRCHIGEENCVTFQPFLFVSHACSVNYFLVSQHISYLAHFSKGIRRDVYAIQDFCVTSSYTISPIKMK